jgi:hypothetical protein
MDGLREYASEAEQVSLLKTTQGWEILARDCSEYKKQIAEKLAYLDPKKPEYSDLRILFIASDKILKMV